MDRINRIKANAKNIPDSHQNPMEIAALILSFNLILFIRRSLRGGCTPYRHYENHNDDRDKKTGKKPKGGEPNSEFLSKLRIGPGITMPCESGEDD